eukprot:gnl/Dysnectes_brevis/3721_a4768_738.p1 GENE.gnl/Dysnectes_brevis/3721_a4768_738~~gnl/Dysnectes_brevis/3721_a4768_738.p1  ORF type:complete len:355 (+),score=24.17 gnl/Dysnectes_brevis/3721_a4768_738:71-1135(+)
MASAYQLSSSDCFVVPHSCSAVANNLTKCKTHLAIVTGKRVMVVSFEEIDRFIANPDIPKTHCHVVDFKRNTSESFPTIGRHKNFFISTVQYITLGSDVVLFVGHYDGFTLLQRDGSLPIMSLSFSDIETSGHQSGLPETAYSLAACSVAAVGRTLVVGSSTGEIYLFEGSPLRLKTRFPLATGPIAHIQGFGTDKFLVTSAANGPLVLKVRRSSGEPCLEGHRVHGIETLPKDPEDHCLWAELFDNTLAVVTSHSAHLFPVTSHSEDGDLKLGQSVVVQGHARTITCVARHAGTLVTGSFDGMVTVIDVTRPEEPQQRYVADACFVGLALNDHTMWGVTYGQSLCVVFKSHPT